MGIRRLDITLTCNDAVGHWNGEADPATEEVRVALLLLAHGCLVRRVPAAQHDQLRASRSSQGDLEHCRTGEYICKHFYNDGRDQRQEGAKAPERGRLQIINTELKRTSFWRLATQRLQQVELHMRVTCGNRLTATTYRQGGMQ